MWCVTDAFCFGSVDVLPCVRCIEEHDEGSDLGVGKRGGVVWTFVVVVIVAAGAFADDEPDE